jgi:hypothetical protein
MGFNFGAFAGGLAQGGMSTFKTLNDIAAQKKETELRDAQLQDMQEARASKAALKQAIGEIPQGQTVPVQQFGTGSGGVDEDRPMVQEAIPQAQRMDNFQQRAVALGADPTAVQQYVSGNYSLKGAKRSEERAQAEDDFSNWMQGAVTQVQKDPVGFIKDHLAEYNKPKPGGHLDDKMTAEVVPGAGGVYSFVQKDAKGNVVASTPITPDTAMQGLQHIAFSKYQALPGKFKEASELNQGERKAIATETSAATGAKELQAKMDAGVFRAQANQANAAANASNAHAAVFGNMLQAAKDNKAAGEAMKPFIEKFSALTPEQQAGPEGQAILMQGATAGAKVSKDLSGLVATLRKPDRSTVSPEQEKAAYAALNAVDPKNADAVAAVKALYPAVFGEDPTLAAIRKAYANKTTNTGATNKAATNAAIPATVDKDEIRVPVAPRAVNQGYAVPNGQALLRTPNYSAGRNTFNPD